MRLKKTLFLMVCVLVLVFGVSVTGGVAMAQEGKQVVKITAKKYEYSPSVITLKKGVPAVLEFTSLDRTHGFKCEGLGIRSDIDPKKVNRLEFTPQKTGSFPFQCDTFCGLGHGGMKGTIIVKE